ncbi:MAG: DUF4258 domain-containing protein [Gaiellales bacterium]|nr:DUF4258 domain-containing protein [Gaiellales bacterium]
MEASDAVFTKHALDVLEEREIERRWVLQVVAHPELLVLDAEDTELLHVLARVPDMGGRVLRVIYNRTVIPVRIITAYFDRTMRWKL